MIKDPKKYRNNVAIIIIHNRKILFCRRKQSYYGQDAWQLPQGGVEVGEELSTAVHREIEEETGITSCTILGRTEEHIYYDWPKDISRNRPESKYIGQKQIYFAVSADTPSLKEIRESEEFDKFEWVDAEYILDTVVAFKQPIYKMAFKELKNLLP